MSAIILLATLLLRDYCPEGECWTGLGGCVPSEPGVLCIACDAQGYVNTTSGECVIEVFSFDNAPQEVVSTCPEPNFCRFQGNCLPSQEGVRCEECNGNGYLIYSFDLNTTECVCANNQFNPRQACTPIFQPEVNIVNETVVESNINCNAHQQRELGFFKQPPLSETPNQCYSEVYGPAPGVLTDSNPYEPLFTCNTYCGEDPNPNTQTPGCVTCAGGGVWDPISYSCVCYEGYTAASVGLDFYGQPARVCNACWGFRGQEEDGEYCGSIYTPDPMDGVMRECGGHGVFDNFECICYANVTVGFWELAPVAQHFIRVEGNGTEYVEFQEVQSCVTCAEGFALPDCLTAEEGYTSPPTNLPTSEAPTESPTRSPITECEYCNQELFPNSTFTADFFSIDYSTVVIPNCTDREFHIQFNFVNSTTDIEENTPDATRICQSTPLCQSWTYSLIGNQTYFYFYESTGPNIYPVPADSPGSVAGVICTIK